MLLQGEKKWRIQLSRPLNLLRFVENSHYLLKLVTKSYLCLSFFACRKNKEEKKTDNMMRTAF